MSFTFLAVVNDNIHFIDLVGHILDSEGGVLRFSELGFG